MRKALLFNQIDYFYNPKDARSSRILTKIYKSQKSQSYNIYTNFFLIYENSNFR